MQEIEQLTDYEPPMVAEVGEFADVTLGSLGWIQESTWFYGA
jgi:hypothetical protein